MIGILSDRVYVLKTLTPIFYDFLILKNVTKSVCFPNCGVIGKTINSNKVVIIIMPRVFNDFFKTWVTKPHRVKPKSLARFTTIFNKV